MSNPNRDDWSLPFVISFLFVLLVVFILPRFFRPSESPEPMPAPMQHVVVPRPTTTPTPKPTPTPSPSPTPIPTPTPEPITKIDFDIRTIRFPTLLDPVALFLKERKTNIAVVSVKKQEAAAAEAAKTIEWPESMPEEYRGLVLPGNLGTKVRYFAAGQAGLEAPQMDYISEAGIVLEDGTRAVARWTVAIRFFPDELKAQEDYDTTVADLKAPESGVNCKPLNLGDAAIEGEAEVGALGQKDKVYVVRVKNQVIEMQAPSGSPAEVHPQIIVRALVRIAP